jgi:hypothetical protein
MTEITTLDNPETIGASPADIPVPAFIIDLFEGAKRQVAFTLFADHTLKSAGINNVDIVASTIQHADPTVNRQMVVAYRNEGYVFPDGYTESLNAYLQNFVFEDPEDPSWIPSKMEIEMSFGNPVKAQVYFFAIDLQKIMYAINEVIRIQAPKEKPRAVFRRPANTPTATPTPAKQDVIDIPASSIKVKQFVATLEISGTRYPVDPQVALAVSNMMAALSAKGMYSTEYVQNVSIEST